VPRQARIRPISGKSSTRRKRGCGVSGGVFISTWGISQCAKSGIGLERHPRTPHTPGATCHLLPIICRLTAPTSMKVRRPYRNPESVPAAGSAVSPRRIVLPRRIDDTRTVCAEHFRRARLMSVIRRSSLLPVPRRDAANRTLVCPVAVMRAKVSHYTRFTARVVIKR